MILPLSRSTIAQLYNSVNFASAKSGRRCEQLDVELLDFAKTERIHVACVPHCFSREMSTTTRSCKQIQVDYDRVQHRLPQLYASSQSLMSEDNVISLRQEF